MLDSQKHKYVDPENKILYFPSHLRKWLAGEKFYPINMEVDLSNACQLKCKMCNYASVHNGAMLKKEDFDSILTQLSDVGVRSITWSGGGDPLTNPNAGHAFEKAWDLGMKQGVYTNGINLDKFEVPIDRYCDWVHVSLHAATPKIYKEMTGKDCFERVTSNISHFIKTKHKIIVGLGMVTTPENMQEIREFYNLSLELKTDYCGFKPSCYISDPKILKAMWEEVNKLPDSVTKTPYRYLDQMLENPHPYKACHAHNFTGSIGANSDLPVWLCCSNRGIEKMKLGSLKEKTFKEIWDSTRRKDITRNIDLTKCMRACKPHVLNKTLDLILNVNPHAEFL